MHRLLFLSLVVLVGSCATLRTRPAATPDEIRAALTEVKTAVVQAYIDLDAEALGTLYTDDFTVADEQGRVRTKADELAYVRSKPERRLRSGRYTLTAVRVYGDLAVAAGHARMLVDGPQGRREVTYRSFNVFRWERGRWRYAAAFTP